MKQIRHIHPIIDPHVHLRGLEYDGENFARKAFEDARASGVVAILEQPNPVVAYQHKKTGKFVTDRKPEHSEEYVALNLTSPALLSHRISQLKPVLDDFPDITYRAHLGMTNDMEQNRQTLEYIMLGWPYSSGADKTFYVHSTGNMGILDEEKTRDLWKLKGEMGYKGVSIGHHEDENWFRGKFDPKNPISHSFRQNENAELFQVMKQFQFAYDAGFKGTFYVAHVSNPLTIDFLNSEIPTGKFDIVIETTPHHMLLNYSNYTWHENRVKMNPPLRFYKKQEAILERVLNRETDIIGTDHAPHTLAAKDHPTNPASGIPGLHFWPRFIEILKENGMGDDRIKYLTYKKANQLFKLNLPSELEPVTKTIDSESATKKYGWDSFSTLFR